MPKLSRFICIGLMSIVVSSISFPVYAKCGSDKSNLARGVDNSEKESKSKKKFSAKDRKILKKFFSIHPVNTAGLSPENIKNLVCGKTFPPDVAKVFLPQYLNKSLGPHPGYDYLMVGRNALLVNQSNQVIEDILYNIC